MILQPINFRYCDDCCLLCKPPLLARLTDHFSALFPTENETQLDASDFLIYDHNGTLIDTLDSNDIDYVAVGTQYYVKIYFKWSKYISTNGVYKLCFRNEKLGAFDSGLWIESGTAEAWYFSTGNYAGVDLTVGQQSKLLTKSIYFEKCNYELKLRVTGVQISNPGEQSGFDILLDGEVISTTVISVGANDITVNFTIEYEGTHTLSFLSTAIASDCSIHIEDATNPSLDNTNLYEDLCSECFEIGDHDCSLLIEAYNDQDSYGLDDSFRASLRIWGKNHKVTPEHIENIYRNNPGSYTNTYTDISLCSTLETKMLFKDQLLALILMLSFDNVTIDKIAYVKREANIEIQWDNKYQFGSFKCDMYLKDQNFRKEFT